MEILTHSLSNLFEQLGLANSETNIEQFIDRYHGIKQGVALHNANFWSPSQAAFLHEAIDQDSDWAEVVDHLDVLLRD